MYMDPTEIILGTINALLANIWIVLFILLFLIPTVQKKALELRRLRMIHDIEKNRGSRLITIIHRQESISFLGIPIFRYIDIEDSERVLRACRFTPEDMPVDIILHTPGGLVLASAQIAAAVRKHKAKVTVFVPHYAMSGGTLIALAADEIAMDQNAVLGPVDPIIGTAPAASILAALSQPNPNRDDQTLIMGDVAAKAVKQMRKLVLELISDRMPGEKAVELANTLTSGRWTHDYPITSDEAAALGLPVTTEMPVEIYELMQLYPQAVVGRPSVEYIPVPYKSVPPRK